MEIRTCKNTIVEGSFSAVLKPFFELNIHFTQRYEIYKVRVFARCMLTMFANIDHTFAEIFTGVDHFPKIY